MLPRLGASWFLCEQVEVAKSDAELEKLQVRMNPGALFVHPNRILCNVEVK